MIEAEILVVGAGFAGLSAARALTRAGRTVAVLEARERVGGRVYTKTLADGTPVDLGGQWVGPTQDRLYALAKEVGVDTFATYGDGHNLLYLGGTRKKYKGTIPNVSPLPLLNLGWAMSRLDALAKTVNLEAPWDTPNAAELDGQTLASMIARHVHFSTAHELLKVGLETVFAADAADISLLHAAFYVKSGKGLDSLVSTVNGAQQDRFVGGAQPIADKLAALLAGSVHLSSPVREIAQTDDGVEVRGDGLVARGRRVVVCVPPTLAGRIRYAPALPAARDQLTQRMPMGSVIKCMAVYDTPFWRDEGLSGQAVSDVGPVQTTFDNSPPGGTPGVLLGFVEANAARELAKKSEAERRELVLGCFARYFGERARSPRDYVDKSWADDEWSRGCYAAYMPPGVWTSYGRALTAPIGRIHWAGTETSPEWNGYIEGALASGARAANEVLGVLEREEKR
jgi:monoamine oxidase